MRNWSKSRNFRDHWFDTLELKEIEIFDSGHKSQISLKIPEELIPIYVCGLTPYDSAHLGHAFTYSVFDLLVRFLRQCNKNVEYVQNITDVDDPLFERARRDKRDWKEIAKSQVDLLEADMEKIGVNPPDVFTPVSDQMSAIIEANSKLLNQGDLYRLENDWYYQVSDVAHPLIDELSNQEMIKIFSQRGGDPTRAGKRNQLDPVVWKQSMIDEPTWNSELGVGRPGWHIECVAIIAEFLQLPLLIQGGGKDLIFPHHTMCAWQTKSLTGNDLAQSYLHAGLVSYQGEKMSKSLGNLVFVSELIAQGFSPAAVRLQLLSNTWNLDWEWFENDLVASQARIDHWRKYVSRVPADAEFIEFTFNNLRQNLNIAPIFKRVDELESKAVATLDLNDSVQAFLSDVLGLQI